MFYCYGGVILKCKSYSCWHYLIERITDWLKVCSDTGEGLSHSMEVEILLLLIHLREEEIPSQIIHINKITEMNEIKLPSEDTTFHVVKLSG